MNSESSERDWAIIIGIDRYPELEESVPGATEDARAFRDWLITDGVPADQVTLLLSEESTQVTRAGIEEKFDALAALLMKKGRIGRRCYLYATGLGGQLHEDTLLLASDATRDIPRAIAVHLYANYLARAGAFDEIVLIVDLQRVKLRMARVLPLSYSRITSDHPASKFYVTAGSPRGDATRMLLDGLWGNAVVNGVLSSDNLMRNLAKRWEKERPGTPTPEIEATPYRSILFNVPTKPPDPSSERVRAHSDDPARLDELGRRPFAEVLGQRLDEVWADAAQHENAGAFMINVDGPWGSGKTSVLNLLRTYLQDEKRAPKRRWVIVEFNAWRQQRRRPPWWILIKEVYRQSARHVGFFRSMWLRTRWLAWRVRADWLPVLFASTLIALAAFLPAQFVTDSAADSGAKLIELALKIIIAVGAVSTALITFTRSLAFGSARAAQTYSELRSDPLGPIVTLFERLVRAIRRPVAIFVDDIDRCETAYVVELLEGIQTLYRSVPVAYVVAADRKWIVTSFEKAYENFSKSLGEPGRPLGYLFLEKVFQVSASLPLLPQQTRQRYWSGLLRRGAVAAPDVEQKQAEDAALESVRGLRTIEELDAKIEEVKGDALLEPAMRAAAAKQIASTEAQQAITHRLESCADLLESNPRAMKRLVNAFGFHQATHFLEGRSVSPGALARWTVMELRWPLLSEYLTAHPSKIGEIGNGNNPTGVPKELNPLFDDADVKRVVGGGQETIALLDEASLRAIVGM